MKAFMSHRKRVLTALAHCEPDRVPLDLGSTRNTGITIAAYERLLEHLGLEGEASLLQDFGGAKMQGLATVDDQLLQWFDIDTRGIMLGPRDNWQDIQLPDDSYRDEWGVVRRRAPGSDYYDLVSSPLDGEITVRDIARFEWPDPYEPGRTRGLREKALHLHQDTNYAVVLHLPDIFVHKSQFMRGFEQWFMDLILDPKLIEALMDAILEIQLAEAESALALVGDLVDIVSTSDDVAGQNGPVISPDMYRRFIKPRHKKFFDLVHSLTAGKVLFHSCGSVYALLGDFIDIGIDILNPVQVSAAEMDAARLKKEYGDRLVFWGGIDTQRVLPYGTPAEVRHEVRSRIDDLAPGGGYVLTAVHNIQPDVPPENICAMYESAVELGQYPIEKRACTAS